MHTKHHLLFYCIVTLLAILFTSLIFIFPTLQKFMSPEIIRTFIVSFGIFASVIYVLLITIITPFNIPSTPIIFAGGYIFGICWGIVLSIIGMVLGSTLAFYTTRFEGKLLLKKWIGLSYTKHFNAMFKKRGLVAALISYAIPLFPSATVSLFLGLTNITYSLFFLLALLGHIPRVLIIILLGSDFYTGFSIRTVIIVIIAIMFVLIAAFRERIKRILFTELLSFEKEIDTIESVITLNWFN